MPHVGLLCRGRHVLALLNLTFRTHRPEVLNAVDAIHTLRSACDRPWVLQVSLDNLHALTCQGFRFLTAWSPGQRSQLPSLREHMSNNGATLSARRPGYKDCFVRLNHIHPLRFFWPDSRLPFRWTPQYNTRAPTAIALRRNPSMGA